MKYIQPLRILILLALTLSVDKVMAQNRTVVEVEVEKNDNNSRKNTLGVKNLIKINPLLFLRGDIPIYYERALSDKFSIEVGLGMTTRDYISSLTTLNGDVYQDNLNIETKIGYSVNIGARYYPSNYTYQPEGVYFGLDYRLQQYNATVTSANDVPQNFNISQRNNDARIMFGYLNYFEENVFIEFYSGIGVRNKVYDSVALDNTGGFNSVAVSEKSFLLPYLSLGFKLGLAF